MLELCSILTALLSVALFTLPFQKQRPDFAAPPRDPVTLIRLVASLLAGVRGDKPKHALLRLVSALLLLSILMPPLILLEAGELQRTLESTWRFSLAAQAMMLLAGAAACSVILIFSNLTIGFSSSRSAVYTPLAPLLPLYYAGWGIAAIVLSLWHF